jgi:hypothetical protein
MLIKSVEKTLRSRRSSALLVVAIALAATGAPQAANSAAPPFRTRPPIPAVRPESPIPFASPGVSSAPIAGLSIVLLPETQPYHAGRGIAIGFHFTNTNRTPAHFWSASGVRFEVSGDSAAIVHHKLNLVFNNSGKRNDSQAVIPVGASFPFLDDLSETYALKPGTYSVRAIVFVTDPRVVLTSPPISITVIK